MIRSKSSDLYSSLVVRLSLNSGYVKNDHWKLVNSQGNINVGKSLVGEFPSKTRQLIREVNINKIDWHNQLHVSLACPENL